MTSRIAEFTERLYSEWLPAFCSRTDIDRTPDGFRPETLARLDEFDADWFLRAIETGVVTETRGMFTAAMSGFQEQLFSTGSKTQIPRPLTLWTEPIITIGALARLHVTYGWPVAQLGAQPKPFAFDFAAYRPDLQQVAIAGEVKKNTREIETLHRMMVAFGREGPLSSLPSKEEQATRNAYKKVLALRATWPALVWLLGPGDTGQVLRVLKEPQSERFELDPIEPTALKYI